MIVGEAHARTKRAARRAPPRRPLVDMVRARQRDRRRAQPRLRRATTTSSLQASSLHEAGVRVRTLSLFYEQWLGKLPIAELERVSLLFDIGELHAAGYARVKRLLDVALASAGLVALALVDSRSCSSATSIGEPWPALLPPAAHRPERRHVRDAEVPHDARSTSDDDAATGPTEDDDPRITPFGRRAPSDPSRRAAAGRQRPPRRPLRRRVRGRSSRRSSRSWSAKIPFYGLRHLVRPGLTGWAQVKYRYAGTEAETLEKLQYEFFYLRHQSLGLDLRIVGRTCPHRRSGREGR